MIQIETERLMTILEKHKQSSPHTQRNIIRKRKVEISQIWGIFVSFLLTSYLKVIQYFRNIVTREKAKNVEREDRHFLLPKIVLIFSSLLYYSFMKAPIFYDPHQKRHYRAKYSALFFIVIVGILLAVFVLSIFLHPILPLPSVFRDIIARSSHHHSTRLPTIVKPPVIKRPHIPPSSL